MQILDAHVDITGNYLNIQINRRIGMKTCIYGFYDMLNAVV